MFAERWHLWAGICSSFKAGVDKQAAFFPSCLVCRLFV